MIRRHATEESAIIVAVNDEALSRLHQRRPAGVALHLRGAESLARGIDSFTRSEPSISADLKLPDWEQPAKLAWPPPRTPLAVLAVQGMAAAVDQSGRQLVATAR
jgi:hypothetical protein